MATTYSVLLEKLYRTLADARHAQTSEDLAWDAICAAHDAIVQWVPLLKTATLTSGSNGLAGDTFPIPEDCYQLDAVQIVDTGAFLPKAVFEPDYVRNTGRQTDPRDWIEFPSGYINLAEEIDEGDLIKIYYRAYWPKPSSKDDASFIIQPPAKAHLGMIYYAAAHCLLPRSVSAGGLRQFNDRSDSGTPNDNPLYNMSNWFLTRFMQEMKLMPPYVKVGG
jgi:hypothetical protein